ncbi:MAG: FlgO family outer membrane protein [Elusimicrobiota bacterium]
MAAPKQAARTSSGRNPRLGAAVFLFAVIGLSVFPAGARAGETSISRRLDGLADSLVQGYRRERPEGEKQTLAVFSFNCSARLARERVGYAIGELLTHKFVQSQTFSVVERTALHEVMEEQKLHLTGAVDSKTAVEVGRLVGAHVLLLGSVEKLAGAYQLNARLVEAETGGILATGYQELPARLFEEKARPYLTVVPKRHKIGIYLLLNYRHNANNLPVGQIQSHAWPHGAVDTSPRPFSALFVGGGVRYFPVERVMFDVSYARIANSPSYARHPTWSYQSAQPTYSRKIGGGNASLLRATVNWVQALSGRMEALFGAGVCRFQASPGAARPMTVVVPSVRTGLEFKIQRRLGIGINFNYDFIDREVTDHWAPHPEVIEFSKWSVEPALALYF